MLGARTTIAVGLAAAANHRVLAASAGHAGAGPSRSNMAKHQERSCLAAAALVGTGTNCLCVRLTPDPVGLARSRDAETADVTHLLAGMFLLTMPRPSIHAPTLAHLPPRAVRECPVASTGAATTQA